MKSSASIAWVDHVFLRIIGGSVLQEEQKREAALKNAFDAFLATPHPKLTTALRIGILVAGAPSFHEFLIKGVESCKHLSRRSDSKRHCLVRYEHGHWQHAWQQKILWIQSDLIC